MKHIFNKSIHLLAFGDDFDIIARSPSALRQGFLSLESVLTYACLTWSMSRTDENVRRIKSNLGLYQSYKESDIVNFIKIQRIKWAGHVVRMSEDRTTKKVFSAQPIGTRRKGKLNLRWIDGIEKNLLLSCGEFKRYRKSEIISLYLVYKETSSKISDSQSGLYQTPGNYDDLDGFTRSNMWNRAPIPQVRGSNPGLCKIDR
ncbi:UNVERIFIED_CONTAM: hypothetical protein NCL1_09865 [Trichonephila clavipes]